MTYQSHRTRAGLCAIVAATLLCFVCASEAGLAKGVFAAPRCPATAPALQAAASCNPDILAVLHGAGCWDSTSCLADSERQWKWRPPGIPKPGTPRAGDHNKRCPYNYNGTKVCRDCCPNKDPYEGRANGCGPAGSGGWKELTTWLRGATQLIIFTAGIPTGYNCLTLFTPWCDEHDYCYGTPDVDRESCDYRALDFFQAACEKRFPTFGRKECYTAADVTFAGIRNFGQGAFDRAQAEVKKRAAVCASNTKSGAGGCTQKCKTDPSCQGTSSSRVAAAAQSWKQGVIAFDATIVRASLNTSTSNLLARTKLIQTQLTKHFGGADMRGILTFPPFSMATGGAPNVQSVKPAGFAGAWPPKEVLVPFAYKTTSAAALQAAIDKGGKPSAVKGLSITPAPCGAAAEGACHPGFVCCNRPETACCPTLSKQFLQPASAKAVIPAATAGRVASVAGPGFSGYNPASPDIAVGPSHVIMVIASSIDIRRKVDVSHPMLREPLSDFWKKLTGRTYQVVNEPRALFDVGEQRFVLTSWTYNSSPQEAFNLFAISKTPDPMQGWTYMAAPLLLPWAPGEKVVAMVDAPHIATTPTAVVMGSQMTCAPAGTKRNYNTDAPEASALLCNPALWVVPKRLPGGGGLMSGSVGRGTRGVHFQLYDTYQYRSLASLQIYPVQTTPTGRPSAIDEDSTADYQDFFNSTYDFLGGVQYVMQRDEEDLTVISQSINHPVIHNQRLYVGLKSGRDSIAGAGPDRPISSASWVVYNLVNLSPFDFNSPTDVVKYPGTINDMVLEAHGTLPVTLDKDVEMFYPTPVVDAAGRMGVSFSAASKAHLYPGAYFACVRPLPSAPAVNTAIKEVKRGEAPVALGRGYATSSVSGLTARWGDYSAAALDPDGATMWTFNTYGLANNMWGTWLSAFKC